jgi:serine/threonine protein kinase
LLCLPHLAAKPHSPLSLPTPCLSAPQVDIFSAGVVWFTTLFYPQKPFFSDASQQQIMKMSSHSMRAETQRLAIPETKPALSAEAAAALRRALAPRRDDRPNAQEMLQDPYFAGKPK